MIFLHAKIIDSCIGLCVVVLKVFQTNTLRVQVISFICISLNIQLVGFSFTYETLMNYSVMRLHSLRSFCLTPPPPPPSQRHLGSLPPSLTTPSPFYAASPAVPRGPPSSGRPLVEPSPLKWAKLRSGGECKSCLVWICELQRDFRETRRGQKQTLAKLSTALMLRKCSPGITNPCLACAFSSTSYCRTVSLNMRNNILTPAPSPSL